MPHFRVRAVLQGPEAFGRGVGVGQSAQRASRYPDQAQPSHLQNPTHPRLVRSAYEIRVSDLRYRGGNTCIFTIEMSDKRKNGFRDMVKKFHADFIVRVILSLFGPFDFAVNVDGFI